MTILALDIGSKNIGLAISDASESISMPLKTILYENPDKFRNDISKIISDFKITKLLVGLPLSLNANNADGSQTQDNFAVLKTKEKISTLEKNFDLQIFYQDERFSSLSAFKSLSYESHKPDNKRIKSKQKKEKQLKNIDNVAASIFLQTFIDSKKNEEKNI